MILVFQIISAIILVIIINAFGKASRVFGYVNISDILEEEKLGFNLIFRLLSPAIFVSFLSIILYKLGAIGLVQNIWLIVLWYIIIHFILLLLLNRWSSVNKLFYLFTQTLSVGIAYWFYNIALSRGLEFILPEGANFRTEIWLIIILYLYSLLNNYESNYEKRDLKKIEIIKKRYLSFYNKYKNILKKDFKKDEFLHRFLFSIMIIEDLNRPFMIRFLERIFFPLGFIKSTGIMQVRSKKILSDKKSINLAQVKILNEYNKIKNKVSNEYELLDLLTSKYNSGQKYITSVGEISCCLGDVKLSNSGLKNQSKNLEAKDRNKDIDIDMDEIEKTFQELSQRLSNLSNELKKIDPKLAEKLKKKFISSIKG